MPADVALPRISVSKSRHGAIGDVVFRLLTFFFALLVLLILGGIGVRRARSGGGAGLLKASTVLATILIAVYVVTVWAMGGKPN